MITERRPELTLPANPQTWEAEKKASIALETHKIPDPYWFYAVGGEILSPFTHALVKNFIETASYLGQAEYAAFEEVERLTRENATGFILWISPPAIGEYPVPKIIVSEIVALEEGRKLLFNRAIILDQDKNDCVTIATQLGGRLFTGPEEVRRVAIFFRPPTGIHWTHFLSEWVYAPHEFAQVRRGEDIEAKAKALRQLEEILVETRGAAAIKLRMEEVGMIGPYPPSCPTSPSGKPTAFELFFKNSLLLGEKKFVKNCGRCGTPINAHIPSGYRCKGCGGEYLDC